MIKLTLNCEKSVMHNAESWSLTWLDLGGNISSTRCGLKFDLIPYCCSRYVLISIIFCIRIIYSSYTHTVVKTFLSMFSLFTPPTCFHTDSASAHTHTHFTFQCKTRKVRENILIHPSIVPSSVWLKPQSRQMDVTQRFMSSSDSATRYQILSSVLKSKTKLLSSSFFVNDRPASTWRRKEIKEGPFEHFWNTH